MDLVRDLLDKRIVDRNHREVGRVDRVIFAVRPGAPPRVIALEVGPAALAARLHPILGRWIAALERACGVADGRPLRITIGEVIDVRDHVTVDLAVGETTAASAERRLRRLLAWIPGAS